MTLAFPYALFPFVAQALDAEWALGWLYAAGAVGGLIAATTSGWVHRVHRHGRGLVIAAVCWGIAIGFSGWQPTFGGRWAYSRLRAART